MIQYRFFFLNSAFNWEHLQEHFSIFWWKSHDRNIYFSSRGYRKHHTGATEGNIHTVNSTGWATGATICKPSKHIMSSYEWQQQKKMAVCNYAATYAISVVWKDCLLRAACRTGSQMIWRKNRLHVYEFKKGNHSISAAFNKGVTRLQNTRVNKNMVNYNFYQNYTNCLGLQIQLHNQNSSIFSSLKLFLLEKESLGIKSFRIKDF